jgi:hypothetical protein
LNELSTVVTAYTLTPLLGLSSVKVGVLAAVRS